MLVWIVSLCCIVCCLVNPVSTSKFQLTPSQSLTSVLKTEYARSPAECATICDSFDGCNTFAFSKSSRSCVLGGTSIQCEDNSLSTARGMRVYKALCKQDCHHIIPVNNKCIHLVTTTATWDDARADCEASGARLLTPKTQAENDWLVTQMDKAGTSNSVFSSEWKNKLWIAARLTDSELRWHEGCTTTEITRKYFHSGHSSSKAECVYLKSSGWWDAHDPCTALHRYVCEC